MGHIRVDLPNTNNKWVGFGLVNVDTFIIRVGFGLMNVDTIRTLTRHEHEPLTRIATPSLIMSIKTQFFLFCLLTSAINCGLNEFKIFILKWWTSHKNSKSNPITIKKY